MNRAKVLFLLIAILTGVLACQPPETHEDGSPVRSVVFTAPPFEEDDVVSTKTNIYVVDGKNKFAWSPNDTVGIFPNSGAQVYFVVDANAGSGTASFDGGGWEFKNGAVYRSYYPFIGDFYLNTNEIPVNYIGQKQTGNDNTDHIGRYDFMYTPAVSAESGSLHFNYKHLSSILRPIVDLPAGHYTNLTLSVSEDLFALTGSFDLTSSAPAISGITFTKDYSMALDITLAEAGQLIVSVMSAPVDLRGKTLSVKILNDQGRLFSYDVAPEEVYAASKIKKIISPVSFAIGSVSVSPAELSLVVDETQQLTATVLPENAANKNVTWTSSNPSVATVSSTGLVTALTPGTTTITVTTVEGGESATCAVTVSEASDLATPLCLQAIEAGTITISNPKGLTIGYKKNSADWVDFNGATTTVEVAAGDRVYFHGNNATYGQSDDVYTNILCSAPAYVYGNVMSLINSNSFASLKKLTASLALSGLFRNNTGIRNHPSRELLLPATTLYYQCYRYMFAGCTGLSSAPELPAMSIPSCGYKYMFCGCIGLTAPPELPATELATNAYFGMFSGCTNLLTAPSLPATNLGSECYRDMFRDCIKLATAPSLPATILNMGCYYNMFRGCSSLKTAPVLSSTNLAEDCYNAMFAYCTSLTVAPELPATTLAQRCYRDMFYGCTKLETAPALPAATLTAECYRGMFCDCKKLTSSPDLLAETLVEGCYRGMFNGCNLLNRIKMLAIDISAEDALTSWTYNVASSGTFIKNYDATWDVTGINGVPTGWTVERLMTRDPILVSSITLNNTSLTLSIGDTQTLTATIAPDNADNKSVSWSSSDATVASVNQTGKVTALKEGTTTITVSAQDGSGKTGTCSVTVNAIPVTGVTLDQTSLSFTVMNQTQQLHATVLPDNATYKTVTWTSNNESVATVSSTGVVTAKGDGTATITATAGGKSATCTVSVTLNVPVTGVSLNKTSTSLLIGATETLTATITPSNATNKNVTWSSSATSVATVCNGIITAEAVGTATITVTTVDGNKTASCTVTVNPIEVTGISLNKTSLNFSSLNATQQLTATVTPSNATNKTVTWSSSDSNVATVSSSGVVTSKGSGSATITATAGSKSATCNVTVNIPVTGVTLNKSSITLAKNATYQLTATVAPSTATNKNVTWSSSNTSVATVSTSGVVTAKAAGTATITVTTADGSKTATCAVTVTVPVTGVSLNKTSTSLSVGATETLTATITPSNATNKNVTWSSSNTAVATVSSTGVVTAVASGTATITVMTADGSKTATCSVTVINPVGTSGEKIIWE